jgi:hypothetical protein
VRIVGDIADVDVGADGVVRRPEIGDDDVARDEEVTELVAAPHGSRGPEHPQGTVQDVGADSGPTGIGVACEVRCPRPGIAILLATGISMPETAGGPITFSRLIARSPRQSRRTMIPARDHALSERPSWFHRGAVHVSSPSSSEPTTRSGHASSGRSTWTPRKPSPIPSPAWASWPPPSVILDFTGVTSAGTSLSHFLIRLRRTVPDAPILMRHASPGTPLVMTFTGTDRLVVQDEEELPWNAG